MKPRIHRFIAITAAFVGFSLPAFAASGTWSTTTSGALWTLNTNWVGNVIADGSGNTADFSQVDLTAADTAVSLNGNRTIGNLIFGDTGTATGGWWSLNGAGVLNLSGGTPTITVNPLATGSGVALNAGLSGTSGFTKNGTGWLVLSSAGNALSGAVKLSAGTLQLNNASLTNATSLAINSGTLVLATTAANAFGGTISFGGGWIQYNSAPGTDYSAQFSTAASQAYNVNTGDQNVTWAGALTSIGGTLTKIGAGTLTLAGGVANTFNGPITVNAGRLSSLNSASLQNLAGAITVASSATFDAKANFGGNITNSFILRGTGSGISNYGALNVRENANLTGAISLAADTLITHDWNIATVSGSITGANTNLELKTLQAGQYGFFMNGPISLGTGALTLTGIGTTGDVDFKFSGTNSFTGGTLLRGGRVSINNASALGSGPVTFISSTSLAATASMTLANALTVNSGVAATLDAATSTTLVQAGTVTGAGTFIKSGLGTVTLSGGLANTLTGPITVNAGRLNVVDGSSLKNTTGAITVASGASFNFSQNFGSNNLTNALTLSGSGDGTLGAFNIQGNSTAAGGITLAADSTISHDYNNGIISGAVTGANKNLNLASTITGQPGLTVNGSINLGSGTLTKTGANSLDLAGTNTWGAMVIEKGVVIFKNTAAMGGSGANITTGTDGVAVLEGAPISTLLSRVNMASTGALSIFSASSPLTDNIDLTNHPSLSIGSQTNIDLSGTITPGGGSYRLGGGGKTLTVSSTLSGSSGLIVNDAQGGTLVLSGGHTYSGTTTVSAGTLQVDGSLSGAVTVAAAGTLAPGPASGIGSLTLASPLTAAGKLSFRIDRSNAQTADLITAPSIALTGVLSVNNIGPALQAGDSFKLFDISGSFTQSQVIFSLPTLSNGLMWDGGSLLTTGTLTVASVTSSPVGDTAWPGLLPLQIQAAKLAGNASVKVNPGIYQMPDKRAGEVTFDLNGWTNFTIDATGVTLVVGKQRTFQLTGCDNVTITGCTIRARYPSFTQGRVLSKGTNPNGTVYAIWKISDGYPTTFAIDPAYVPSNPDEAKVVSFNAVNQNTRLIDLETGDHYGTIATAQGNNTWKIDFPNTTALPFIANDWLVTRLTNAEQQLPAVRLDKSKNCTLQSLTSQGGGFASVFENGGGGNHLWDYRIECSPDVPVGGTETPVVSSAADGVHTVSTYPGLDVKDCIFTGVFLDDCIAIHGDYSTVLSVSGSTVTMNGAGHFAMGDPVRFSNATGFFAQATCTAVAPPVNGTVQVTLDQTLAVPIGAKASNPKTNGSGFRIINCQLGNTRSRAIITKGDDGLISGCTISHSGAAINIGPEYYWNESDYCWNNTVVGNLISDCAVGVNLVQGGAIGNRNLSVIDNSFSRITRGNCISLDGCDGATISGNSFATPTAAEAIRLNNSTNITLANNLVAYAPNGKAVLAVGPSVTAVQGAANGVLYSGRAYAFSNSLSGLLLAHPSSNAVGATLQQYSNSNASSRWILQSDGNGYCKIISAANGLVAGVNQSASSAAPLILETSGPGQGQRWTLAPVGTSAIKLVNRLSGLAATVQTGNLSETITQLADTSAAGQLWTPAPDDPPVATAQSVTTAEDSAKAITLAGTDLQGSPFTYTIVTPPASGTLTGTAPNLSYTPNTNFNGTDSFTYRVNDGALDSLPATVSISVTPVNDVPVFAINPFAAGGATESLAYTGQALAGRATDADAGDTITYSKVSGPAWLVVAPNGTLSGTPPFGSAGLNTFSVCATDSAAATAVATLEITVAAQPLPLPWLKGDIGTGMLPGSVTHNAGTFTQAGSGVIGSSSDKLNFAYQTLTGDGEIIARISVLQNTGTSSRVGVMIRDTLASNSKQIFMGMTSTNAYRWDRRTATGGTTTSSNSSTGTVPNTWVRLVRTGTTITAYKSSNGTSWTSVGSTTGTTFASTCYIGLAVSSGSTTTLNTSQFSDVTVTP